jgi:hypothetical protein
MRPDADLLRARAMTPLAKVAGAGVLLVAGDPAFDTMTPEDRLEVNRAVANLGKALEAYMRKIAAGPSAIDSSEPWIQSSSRMPFPKTNALICSSS